MIENEMYITTKGGSDYDEDDNDSSTISEYGNEKNKGQLKRNTIGVIECIALSVGGIGLSAATFFVYPNIAGVAGTSVPFALIIGAICCLTMASTINTFSRYINSSSSFFYYIGSGLGNEMGFLSVWILMIGYLTVIVSVLLQFCGAFADVISRHTPYEFPWVIGAVIAITIIPTLAYVGIDIVLKTSIISMILETLIMLVLTLIIVIKGGDQGNYPLAFTPVGEYAGSISGLSKALVYAVFVFVGFEGAATLGRETRNPKKSIPIAVIGAVCFSTIWLTWAMYAMVVAQGPSKIFSIGTSPIEGYARIYVGYWFSIIVDIAGLISTFGVVSSWFNIVFRIIYSIGKTSYSKEQGGGLFSHLISKLSITNKKFKTPHFAIISLSIFLILMVTIIASIGDDIYAKSCWKFYNYLSYIGTIPVMIIFIITNIAVIPYMKNNQPLDFKIFNHLILPILSSILFIAALFGNFFPDTPKSPYSYLLISLGSLIIIGIFIMFYLKYYKKNYLNNMLYQMNL